MFYISLSHVKSLKYNMSITCTTHFNLHWPHFKYLSTFQVLNSHECLVATTLDSQVPDQWFARYGTQISSSSIAWEVLEVKILGPHSKPNEADPLGEGATNLSFNKSLVITDVHLGLRTIALETITLK